MTELAPRGKWTTEAIVMDDRRVDAALAAHRIAGRSFMASGVGSFVREQGAGETIVLMHGLPVSSFVYRKVIPRLAAQGFRAVSFDLPGLGLAERPAHFDYSIRGLAQFSIEAINALGIEEFHLVVHDLGGPVGFQTVNAAPERILSLTVLNTMLTLGHAPFPGGFPSRLSPRFLGALASPRLFRELMLHAGVVDANALSAEDIEVHRRLLLGPDQGTAYLRIVRALRHSDAGPWHDVVDERFTPYPVDIGWGGRDPVLSLGRFGFPLLHASHRPWLRVMPARHYLQEDRPDEVAALIVRTAMRAHESELNEYR